MPAPSLNRDEVTIIVCESMAREMGMVAREKNIPFTMHVLSSQCHRDPVTIGNKIDKMLDSFKNGKRVFVAYGKCLLFDGGNRPGTYRLKETNCSSVLMGGDREYKKMAAGSYFLTPHLALHWKEYFLEKKDYSSIDQKSAQRLEKWFGPIKRVVKINIQPAGEKENLLAEEFSATINKPLIYHSGTLDLLRYEYNNFCSALE